MERFSSLVISGDLLREFSGGASRPQEEGIRYSFACVRSAEGQNFPPSPSLDRDTCLRILELYRGLAKNYINDQEQEWCNYDVRGEMNKDETYLAFERMLGVPHQDF